MNKLALIGLFVVLTIGLKTSEVGVNDWAINTLGEVRDISFNKNKVYFMSYLNSLGILDKFTGNL